MWSWIDLERGVLTIPPSAEKSGRVRDELRRAGLPPQAVALLAEQRSALFAEGIRSELRVRHEHRRASASGLPQADLVPASRPPVERLATIQGQASQAAQRRAARRREHPRHPADRGRCAPEPDRCASLDRGSCCAGPPGRSSSEPTCQPCPSARREMRWCTVWQSSRTTKTTSGGYRASKLATG